MNKKQLARNIRKIVTFIAVIILALSICAIDSQSFVPMIGCIVSAGWLGMYAYYNGYID